ncbi:MAG: hypothetical protein Kow00108_17080 [Calditrichia bacterium]
MNDKKKDKKFVELFSQPFDTLSSANNHHKKDVLKQEEVKVEGIFQKIDLPTDEEEPSVSYYEHNGRIETIEFKCTCGKTLKLKLKYPDQDSDNIK